MNITSHNHKKNKTVFGQRINIGHQLGNRTLALYADYATFAAKSHLPAFNPTEAMSYYQKTLAYTRKLLETRKPLNPTVLSDEVEKVIKSKKVFLSSVDSEIQQQSSKIDSDYETVFNIAGNRLGQEYEKEIMHLHTKVMGTDPKSPEFIKRIIETNEFLADGLKVEMNTESGRLAEIVNSDEATIFIANHGHPYDGCIAAAFYAELYKTYEKAGKTMDIPLPKLVAVKSYIDGLPEKLLPSFRKVESVGINIQPFLTDVDAKTYKKTVEPLTQGFVLNKNHVLIFPEGRRGFYKKDLSLQDRFQNVTTLLVQKALMSKDRVKVVPLGFNYKSDLASIHIGNPLYLSKKGSTIAITKGNITSDCEAAKTSLFYKKLSELPNGDSMTITYKGVPVKVTNNNDLMSRMITGILATNLDISAKLSASAI